MSGIVATSLIASVAGLGAGVVLGIVFMFSPVEGDRRTAALSFAFAVLSALNGTAVSEAYGGLKQCEQAAEEASYGAVTVPAFMQM